MSNSFRLKITLCIVTNCNSSIDDLKFIFTTAE